jgi:sulfite exporter TauE/SafE
MIDFITGFPLIFGFVAAAAHVLAGPDHLAAIAPLALNTKFRPWLIGMAWGVGHLVGMLVIGILFFFFRELIPVEIISDYSERIVGFLLILIGVWSIMRLFHFTNRTQHKHVHSHNDDTGNAFVHVHDHNHGESAKHAHPHHEFEQQTYLAALGIGVIHGLAGFSHILNLLPTLAFPNRIESALYLLGFGGGTISAMVLFSAVLGLISQYSSQQRKEVVYKVVNAVAGIGAIFVGFIWLWNTW